VIAAQLVTMITAAHPDRAVHVVADAWYAGTAGAAGAARGGTRGRGWPQRASLTSRLRVNAVLNAIATPIPGKGGRPRRIGARLGTPSDLATTARWIPATGGPLRPPRPGTHRRDDLPVVRRLPQPGDARNPRARARTHHQ